jgi:hypothetical protein
MEEMIVKSNKYFLLAPLITTIILAGPVGWFFIDLSDKNYSRIPFLFVMSLVLTAVSTIQWMIFLKNKADLKDKNNS